MALDFHNPKPPRDAGLPTISAIKNVSTKNILLAMHLNAISFPPYTKRQINLELHYNDLWKEMFESMSVLKQGILGWSIFGAITCGFTQRSSPTVHVMNTLIRSPLVVPLRITHSQQKHPVPWKTHPKVQLHRFGNLSFLQNALWKDERFISNTWKETRELLARRRCFVSLYWPEYTLRISTVTHVYPHRENEQNCRLHSNSM